jgi:hypothetical protein
VEQSLSQGCGQKVLVEAKTQNFTFDEYYGCVTVCSISFDYTLPKFSKEQINSRYQ